MPVFCKTPNFWVNLGSQIFQKQIYLILHFSQIYRTQWNGEMKLNHVHYIFNEHLLCCQEVWIVSLYLSFRQEWAGIVSSCSRKQRFKGGLVDCPVNSARFRNAKNWIFTATEKFSDCLKFICWKSVSWKCQQHQQKKIFSLLTKHSAENITGLLKFELMSVVEILMLSSLCLQWHKF